MSTEKMSMFTLTGPVDMTDYAIQRFVVNRDFHPENAITALEGTKALLPFDEPNPYAGPLAMAEALQRELGIKPEYRDFSAAGYELEPVKAYLDSVGAQLEDWKSERDIRRREVLDAENLKGQLEHFTGVDEDLLDLFNMRYVKLRFGRILASQYADCLNQMKEQSEAFFIRTGDDEQQWVYCMYFVLPSDADHIDALLASMGWERIRVKRSAELAGTAEEALARISEGIDEDKSRANELDSLIDGLKGKEGEGVLSRRCWLRYMNDCFELRAMCGQRKGRFYITGWIPAGDAEEYEAECASVRGFDCIITDAGEVNRLKPPVKLKGGFLQKLFSPFMEMYGLPVYGEIDPRVFMAVTYTVLFGIMFGDLGQGAVLVIVGLLLWKKTKAALWRIISFVGLSSMVFGCIYGSVFGYEDLLPWEGFYVLDGANMTSILLYAVGIGMLIILCCMVMNIINGIRAKDIEKIFFSPNGLVGGVFYLSIVVGVVRWYAFKTPFSSAFSLPYVLCLIVLPLLVLYIKEPLIKLCRGQKDWMPKSVGMFLLEGFFELFETLLSYMSNTISFLRVGAFAISHAGMMMVVFMLSQTADGGNNLLVVIIGNIFVLFLEAALSCIQLIRLEFYEMFGRFYTGGGVRFSPRKVDYAALSE